MFQEEEKRQVMSACPLFLLFIIGSVLLIKIFAKYFVTGDWWLHPECGDVDHPPVLLHHAGVGVPQVGEEPEDHDVADGSTQWTSPGHHWQTEADILTSQ